MPTASDRHKPVRVSTDADGFASMTCERALVELSKDGDSPNCPHSWTYAVWFDGDPVVSSCDETTLERCVDAAASAIDEIIAEYSALRDYLVAYARLGWTPTEGEE